jgi:hypothetical protein
MPSRTPIYLFSKNLIILLVLTLTEHHYKTSKAVRVQSVYNNTANSSMYILKTRKIKFNIYI